MSTSYVRTRQWVQNWLKDKPQEWGQVLAMRAALRALPSLNSANIDWKKRNILPLLRTMLFNWASCNYRSRMLFEAMRRSSFSEADKKKISKNAVNTITSIKHASRADNSRTRQIEDYSFSIVNSMAALDANSDAYVHDIVWSEFDADCEYLLVGSNRHANLSSVRLWHEDPSRSWVNKSEQFGNFLNKLQGSQSVWNDWFERRMRGERTSFDIPGDVGSKEDKAILMRLAAASDEGFWDKGPAYVNSTLHGWLEEARARVAPVAESDLVTPPQEPGAIAFGINKQGKVDRLPPSDQVHLRDVPDQRRSYADLRAATVELLEEGQRLGPRLHTRLERFAISLPARFEDAEAYLVWRDGIALRRQYRAHLAVVGGKDPDPARLDAAVAEGLGGVLDLYNAFAFGDEGIRAKDETTIAPQERRSAEAEAAVAEPLVAAILAAPEIATLEALDDITADAESADLPADDPYAGQALDQANRTKSNFFVALLEGAKNSLNNPKLLGKRLAIGVAAGTGTAIGTVAAKSILGLNYGPLLEFVATNGAILQDYVAVAFSGYPHLPGLIESIGELWKRIRPR